MAYLKCRVLVGLLGSLIETASVNLCVVLTGFSVFLIHLDKRRCSQRMD